MADAEKSEINRDSDSLAHGIEEAIYCRGDGEPYYQPVMRCVCGFSTGRCASWEAAGRELDLHLLAVGAA
jgi:hypothetical protein